MIFVIVGQKPYAPLDCWEDGGLKKKYLDLAMLSSQQLNEA